MVVAFSRVIKKFKKLNMCFFLFIIFCEKNNTYFLFLPCRNTSSPPYAAHFESAKEASRKKQWCILYVIYLQKWQNKILFFLTIHFFPITGSFTVASLMELHFYHNAGEKGCMLVRSLQKQQICCYSDNMMPDIVYTSTKLLSSCNKKDEVPLEKKAWLCLPVSLCNWKLEWGLHSRMY